jgi:PE family
MQSMQFDSGAGEIGSQIVDNAMQGVAASETASAALTALVPAGIDEVSLRAAAAFAKQGTEMLELNAMAQQELCRAGLTFSEVASMYSAVDAASAGGLVGVSPR